MIPSDALALDYDSFLVDLDGVVYVGPEAVPGAADTLAAIGASGRRITFVTNNASRAPDDVAAHLTDLGIPAGAGDVLTSAQAGAAMLAREIPTGCQVLAVGGPGVAAALTAEGFSVIDAVTQPMTDRGDDVAAVLQGFGQEVGWRALARAAFAVGRGVPWVATNTDLTIPVSGGIAPGNGTLVAAVSTATGRVPEVAGKPFPPLLLKAAEVSGGLRPLVVGDRLDTDIEGAANAKIASLLVLSGVTRCLDLWRAPMTQRPDTVALDLRGLLDPPRHIHREDGAVRCGLATATIRGNLLDVTEGEDPVGAVWAAAHAVWDAAAEPDNAIEAAARLDRSISETLDPDTDR